MALRKATNVSLRQNTLHRTAADSDLYHLLSLEPTLTLPSWSFSTQPDHYVANHGIQGAATGRDRNSACIDDVHLFAHDSHRILTEARSYDFKS